MAAADAKPQYLGLGLGRGYLGFPGYYGGLGGLYRGFYPYRAYGGI